MNEQAVISTRKPTLKTSTRRPYAIAIALFLGALFYYAYTAASLPTLFNIDNHLNISAIRYIAEHHKLPIVSSTDTEVIFSEIGTTRSLRPPFTFIVSAVVSNLLDEIVSSEITRFRLGSALIGSLSVAIAFIGFHFAFKHMGLALLGSVAIGLMPKFVFLSSSINDDIGAIFAVSLLFTSTLALAKYKRNTWVLFTLAFSLGLVFQTKFTAWLVLPWLGSFCLIVTKQFWQKKLKLLSILLIVVIVAGAWWPVFNVINYGVDDPTALKHSEQLQRSSEYLEPNQQGYLSKGIGLTDLLTNHDQFLSKTWKSFIGYLQWIELEMSNSTYLFYASIFAIGIINAAVGTNKSFKQKNYLEPLILLMIISQCLFYLHHNLVRDIQPQGRYILPLLMPAMYLFLKYLADIPVRAATFRFHLRVFDFQAVSSAALMALCVALHFHTLSNHIRPSYVPTPYYSDIKNTSRYDLEYGLNISSANLVTHRLMDNSLEIKRTGTGQAELFLDDEFCNILPLNSLIRFNISSALRGSFHLRLDRNNEGTFQNMAWSSFQAGESVALLSIDSRDCTGAKITLTRDTQGLTFTDMYISELRIHAHGKPI